MALVIEEKYDQVRQLINMGKERGYLLYDEVNDIFRRKSIPPRKSTTSFTFERYGIDVYEDLSSAKAALAAGEAGIAEPAEEKFVFGGTEEVDLDLTPGALEKTNDPVRMYLREMGTVPC